MPLDMRLSSNELRALFSRACEAVLPKNHDFAALAELFIWMECRQLYGVEAILESASEGANANSEFNPHIISENVAEFDGSDVDFLRSLPQLADFMNWKATHVSGFTFDCGNIGSGVTGWSAVALLALIKDDCMAVWGHDGNKYMALKRAGDAEPELWVGKGHEHVTGLAIRAYSDEGQFLKDRNDWTAEHKDVVTSISMDQFSNRARQARLRNIPVTKENYRSVCRIADTILVEATDASRKGAGE